MKLRRTSLIDQLGMEVTVMSLQLHMHRGGRTLAEVSGLQTVSSERNIKNRHLQGQIVCRTIAEALHQMWPGHIFAG